MELLSPTFCRHVPVEQIVPLFGQENVMSKQQALLETLLGAAELKGNQMVATSIRNKLFKTTHSHEPDGYQRLASAAFPPRCPQRKAA
jgi:hypothetical protein